MPDLENVLSTERLARYPGATLAEQLVLYRWNVALCQGRDVLPGDVVAGVTFGFWRGLFFDPFENAWRAVGSEVFPNAPVEFATRKALNRRIDTVHRFRNRVFHHEPVFHWHDLADKHTTMHELLGWLSSSALMELERLDTFPATFANDPRETSNAANPTSR